MENDNLPINNLADGGKKLSIDEFYGVPAVHSKRRAIHQKIHSCLFFLISYSCDNENVGEIIP